MECVCSITVIGVVAAVVLPVVNSATTSCVNAARARDVSENAAYALDRCVELLRDAPLAPGGSSLDLTAASPTSISFADGRGLSFATSVLSITDAAGVSAPLIREVESFSIGHFAQDGVTSTLNSPGDTWIYTITLKVAGFELRNTAFARSRSRGP